jgi:membrane-bound lytic murein transglycosylase B
MAKIFLSFLLIIALQANSHAAPKATGNYGKHVEALALADQIALNQNLDLKWVRAQMREAKRLPVVVKLMTPPAVGAKKNWAVYRSRFVTPIHIEAGVAFWQRNQEAFKRAEEQYGVPAHIILGIVGVETIYGRNTGSFRVLDALATLSFDYPKDHPRRDARIAFFKNELEQFLVLSKQLKRGPSQLKGSYAGAMGWPQFMPSSWIKHAIDFDNDGKIDLWQSNGDVIGSVANYFQAYGWKAEPAKSSSDFVELENGDEATTQYPADENFFVITKYNSSYYYAAAVIELGNAIAEQIQKQKP